MFSMITNESDEYPAPILEAGGVLDNFSYLSLIRMIKELYRRGHRNLIIDMQNVDIIGLPGLLALYSGAMVFNGEQPPETTVGLDSLYSMANRVHGYPALHLKLIGPKSIVKRVLCDSGFPIYDDLEAALTSFKTI